MCGLAGLFTPGIPVDADRLTAMGQASAHRGPDGFGIFLENDVGLVHRRLALVAPGMEGCQPLFAAEARHVLIVNGQLYRGVGGVDDGPPPCLRPDVESDCAWFFPALLTEDSAGLIGRNGPFALAWFDRDARTLRLARDRFGQRPLHWMLIPGGVAFASEVRALTHVFGTPRRRLEGMAAVLRAGYVPGPQTLFEGLSSLRPGHILSFDAHASVRERRFWPTFGAPSEPPTDSAASLLRDALAGAVIRRLDTHRRLGLLLSGGLDSLAILASVPAERRGTITAFTLANDDPRHDESRDAAAAARHFGTRHHIVHREREPFDILEDLVRRTGEPLADSSWMAMAEICRAASSEATVLLTGDGGDELLMGYDRHRLCVTAQRWGGGTRRLASWLARVVPHPRAPRAHAALAATDLPTRCAELAGLVPGSRWRSLLAADLASIPDPLVDAFARATRERGDGVPSDDGLAAAGADLAVGLPYDLMVKADRGAMASGVELWAPFLDPAVADLAGSWPRSTLSDRRLGKLPLRQMLTSSVPSAWLQRPKRGFGVPLMAWLRGSYGDRARDLLDATRSALDPLLAPGGAPRLLHRCLRGETDLAPVVHATVVLALVELHANGALTSVRA